MVEPTTDLEELMGAVARGWCHSGNAEKVMDEYLAETIVDEVLPLLYRKCDTAVERAEKAEAERDENEKIMKALRRQRDNAEAGVASLRREKVTGWVHEHNAMVGQIERLQEALQDIVHASRDDGLEKMILWMRGRAIAALTEQKDQ